MAATATSVRFVGAGALMNQLPKLWPDAVVYVTRIVMKIVPLINFKIISFIRSAKNNIRLLIFLLLYRLKQMGFESYSVRIYKEGCIPLLRTCPELVEGGVPRCGGVCNAGS